MLNKYYRLYNFFNSIALCVEGHVVLDQIVSKFPKSQVNHLSTNGPILFLYTIPNMIIDQFTI